MSDIHKHQMRRTDSRGYGFAHYVCSVPGCDYETYARDEEDIDEVRRDHDAALAQVADLRAALEHIAEHPHCVYESGAVNSPYKTGIADGHRCAAQEARAALARTSADAFKALEERVARRVQENIAIDFDADASHEGDTTAAEIRALTPAALLKGGDEHGE